MGCSHRPLVSRYSDDQFEYRHVQLPKNMLKKIPADYFDSAKGTLKLLWEDEWRALGITQVWLVENDAYNDLIGQGGSNPLYRVWAGSITKYMNRNLIFYCSSEFQTFARLRYL